MSKKPKINASLSTGSALVEQAHGGFLKNFLLAHNNNNVAEDTREEREKFFNNNLLYYRNPGIYKK